ncbi:MAG TPA: Gfo/Idh/MocA family oxidoreductase [Symbiobacteriaceae bacterium]|nr:Gfo/Idh/MocA family oxidoreductase [Symbiobacteriaceae bacterium]
MSNRPIRVGIIGAGAIGYRVAKGFATHAETELVAICDTNPELAAKVAAELGAPRWSTDFRELLDQVDLVYLGVPPKFHHAMALEILAADIHLFCEKPLALNLAEAESMYGAALRSCKVHAVNLSGHYSASARLFLEQLQAGYIGEFRRAEIAMVFPQWPRGWQQNGWIAGREQGGPVREVGPHMFYLILQAFGPVKRVHAMMEYPTAPQQSARVEPACETGAYGVLELASGHLVTVKALCGVQRENEMTVTAYGTGGTLSLKNFSLLGAQDDGALQPLAPTAEAPNAITELVKAVRGEAADLPGFEVGLAIQQILEAWERSAATGEWVALS